MDAMKTISLKLPDDLLRASDRSASALRMSRAAYLRAAVDRMNRRVQKKLRADRLAAVSRKVREESMAVNAEFAAIERATDA
jgi:metal-responsive CopG/Arc/MetJ family transcriptional regulator